MAYTFKHGDRPLEDFTIQRAVGRGGFGEVYYAVSDGGREVALKYLRDNPHVELRGVSHCMNLKSPHLVTIFDVKKSADGEYFIVMEYSSGPSLRDLLIAEPDGIGPQKAAFFLREIGKGLGYLHDQGIVHRDLKPGNVFYDEGYVKIGDYGLSKAISISRHSAQTASVGTVHYMAPEVGSGNYHRGIDIYALGVMLYEMLLGKVPFEGGSMGEVLMKHLTAQPEVADLPQPFGKIIQKALEKDPKDRYQTVYEMIEDLLGVEDVKTSLAGFNPVSLAGIERRATTDEADSPARSPNPAPPFAHMPAAAPAPARRDFDLDARQLPPKLDKRIRATGNKVEQRVRKLEAKYGPRAHPGSEKADGRGKHPVQGDAPRTRGEALQRLLLVAAMAGGLGALVGFISHAGEEGFAAAIIGVMAVSGGLGMGCRLVSHLSQYRVQPQWLERLSLTLPVAFFVIVPMAILSDRVGDSAIATWFALVATVFVVDWRSRIQSGGRGELSIGKAIWPGICAALLSTILTEGDQSCMVIGGGVAASATLVLQALAWLFPLQRWLDGVTAAGNPALREGRFFGHHDKHDETQTAGELLHTRVPEHSEPGEQRFDTDREAAHEQEPFLVDGRPRRWTLTRIAAALICFVSLIAIVACIAILADGTITTSRSYFSNGMNIVHEETRLFSAEEKTALAAAAALNFGLMMFAFRKTTRFRTGGFYRDTLRPALITIALGGAIASIAALDTRLVRGDDEAGVVVGLGFSLLCLLVLLIKRGKRYEAQSGQHKCEDATGEAVLAADDA